jgi:hypothetical protein
VRLRRPPGSARARDGNRALYILPDPLQPGAGDPLALVQRAVERIADIERRRSRFSVKAILLDQGSAQKNAEATSYATQNGIDHVIWQDPDHEGLRDTAIPSLNCHLSDKD